MFFLKCRRRELNPHSCRQGLDFKSKYAYRARFSHFSLSLTSPSGRKYITNVVKLGDSSVGAGIRRVTEKGITYPLIDYTRKAVYGYDQHVEIFYPENHRYFASDGVHGSLPLNFFMDRYLEAYANEMKIFCDAVTNNLKLPVDGNDGSMSVAIALAAKKSHLEHRPVKLSEII